MEQFIHDWGYIALFLYSFGGGFLGLAVASVLAYSGDLNIYICVIVAGISNFVGSQFLFFLARKNKSYAKEMMKNHGRKIALTHVLMQKYGSFIIFIQKYIYGIKTLIPLAMGITKYSALKFTIINALAATLWTCVIGYLSFIAGEYLLAIGEEFKYIGLGAIVLIIAVISFAFRKNGK